MRLEDLPIVSIAQMSDEEALKLILEVRDRRRKRKELVSKKQSKGKEQKLLKGLSREQLEQILEILKGV